MIKWASLCQSVRVGRGVFVLTLALNFVPAVPVVRAQELLPELAAPAAQHKAADEALDKQKLEAIALAAKSYVSALNGVEKSAATSGKTDVVAAVAKERESLAVGTLEPELPAGLPPMRLRGSRQALLGKLTQINADYARRKKQLDGTYMTTLIALQEKAASSPELAKQIAAEKAALLGGGTAGTGGGQKSKRANPKNLVVNGDFEKVVDGKTEGWNNPDRVTVETENNNKFVRFVQVVNNDGTVNRAICDQDVEVPKSAKTVSLSARIRTKDCDRNEKNIPCCIITFLDQQGKVYSQPGQNWGGKNGSWKTIQTESPVPRDASIARVSISNGSCPGQIDFDDVEVTFK